MKQRYYPLRGFGAFASAARCCSAFEERRQYFRAQSRSDERISLADLCWPFTLSIAIRWQSRYETARIWARTD